MSDLIKVKATRISEVLVFTCTLNMLLPESLQMEICKWMNMIISCALIDWICGKGAIIQRQA